MQDESLIVPALGEPVTEPQQPAVKPIQPAEIPLDDAIDKIADHFKVPRELWRSMVNKESGGNVNVSNSEKGAQGLFQIMPACVTDDVQCLTAEGWKYRHQLRLNEPIFTHSLERDVLELQPLEAVYYYEDPGPLLHMHSQNFDFTCTPNHKWVAEYRQNNKARTKTTALVETSELIRVSRAYFIKRIAPFHFAQQETLPDALVSLCGLVFADGSIGKNGHQVDLYQSDKKELFQATINESGLSAWRDDNRAAGGTRWCFTGRNAQMISRYLWRDSRKRLPLDFLLTLSARQAEILWEALLATDAYRICNGHQGYNQSDLLRAQDIQVLVYLRGYLSSLRAVRAEGYGVIGGETVYRAVKYQAQLQRRRFTSALRVKLGYESIESQPVWCPSVANQTWIALSNGHISITGNTARNLKKPNGQAINPKDPVEAAYGGLKLLSDNYKRFRPHAQNDRHAWGMAVAGYHGNPSRVMEDIKRGGTGIPDQDDGAINTQDHVYKILKNAPNVGRSATPVAQTPEPTNGDVAPPVVPLTPRQQAQAAIAKAHGQPPPQFDELQDVLDWQTKQPGYKPPVVPSAPAPTTDPAVAQVLQRQNEAAVVDQAFGKGIHERMAHLKPEERELIVKNARALNQVNLATQVRDQAQAQHESAIARAQIERARQRQAAQRRAQARATMQPKPTTTQPASGPPLLPVDQQAGAPSVRSSLGMSQTGDVPSVTSIVKPGQPTPTEAANRPLGRRRTRAEVDASAEAVHNITSIRGALGLPDRPAATVAAESAIKSVDDRRIGSDDLQARNYDVSRIIAEESNRSGPGLAPLNTRVATRLGAETTAHLSQGEQFDALERLGLNRSEIKALGVDVNATRPAMPQVEGKTDDVTPFEGALNETLRNLPGYFYRGVQKGVPALDQFYAGIAGIAAHADPGHFWKDVHDRWLAAGQAELNEAQRQTQEARFQRLINGDSADPDLLDQTVEGLGSSGPQLLKYAGVALLTRGLGAAPGLATSMGTMGIVSAIDNGDQTVTKQVGEFAKNLALGAAVHGAAKFGGPTIGGRLRSAAAGATAFGGIRAAENVVTGRPAGEGVVPAAALGGTLSALMPGTGEAEKAISEKIVEPIARAAVRRPELPEPARNVLAKIGGFGRAIFVEDIPTPRIGEGEGPRSLAFYKDPQTGGEGGTEIDAATADKYAKAGQPVVRLSTEQYQQMLDRVRSVNPEQAVQLGTTPVPQPQLPETASPSTGLPRAAAGPARTAAEIAAPEIAREQRVAAETPPTPKPAPLDKQRALEALHRANQSGNGEAVGELIKLARKAEATKDEIDEVLMRPSGAATPPTPETPRVPERAVTLKPQVDAMMAGRKPAVILPQGFNGPLPAGVGRAVGPQGQVAIFREDKLQLEFVRHLLDTGQSHLLTGMPNPEGPNATLAAVARDADGNERFAGYLEPGNEKAFKDSVATMWPDEKFTFEFGGKKVEAKVLKDRTSSQAEPSLGSVAAGKRGPAAQGQPAEDRSLITELEFAAEKASRRERIAAALERARGAQSQGPDSPQAKGLEETLAELDAGENDTNIREQLQAKKDGSLIERAVIGEEPDPAAKERLAPRIKAALEKVAANANDPAARSSAKVTLGHHGDEPGFEEFLSKVRAAKNVDDFNVVVRAHPKSDDLNLPDTHWLRDYWVTNRPNEIPSVAEGDQAGVGGGTLEKETPAPVQERRQVERRVATTAVEQERRQGKARRIRGERERRRTAEARALKDKRSGLKNADAWDAARTRVDRPDSGKSVVALDLRNFKVFNEVSEDEGDAEVRRVGDTLNQIASEFPGAQAFRKGGDEFRLEGPTEQIEAMAARVRETHPDRMLRGQQVGMSVGTGKTDVEAVESMKAHKATQGESVRPTQVSDLQGGTESTAATSTATPTAVASPPTSVKTVSWNDARVDDHVELDGQTHTVIARSVKENRAKEIATGSDIVRPDGRNRFAVVRPVGEKKEVTKPAPAGSMNEMKPFPAEMGSLDLPRAVMPQISPEQRGGMANFLKGRGIKWTHEDVAPNTLKPSQREYNPSKVEQSRQFAKDNPDREPRRILVSSDDRILDATHQWLAKLEDAPNSPIPITRIHQPASVAIPELARFPSSTVAGNHKSSGDLAQVLDAETSVGKRPSNRSGVYPQVGTDLPQGVASPSQGLRDLDVPGQREGGGDLAPQIADANSSTTERGYDATSSDVQFLGNLANTQPFRDKGLGGLDVPSQRVVMAAVVNAIRDRKIRNNIVDLDLVSVMDDLLRAKSASQVLLHDKSVLKDTPAVNAEDTVSVLIDTADALIRVVAGLSTERTTALSDTPGRSTEFDPTVSADIIKRHVASPSSVSNVSGEPGSQPGSPPIVSDAAAALADELDKMLREEQASTKPKTIKIARKRVTKRQSLAKALANEFPDIIPPQQGGAQTDALFALRNKELDQAKYDRIKPLLEQAIAPHWDEAKPDTDIIRALARELRDSHGFSVSQISAMSPYLLEFLKEKRLGEEADVSAPTVSTHAKGSSERKAEPSKEKEEGKGPAKVEGVSEGQKPDEIAALQEALYRYADEGIDTGWDFAIRVGEIAGDSDAPWAQRLLDLVEDWKDARAEAREQGERLDESGDIVEKIESAVNRILGEASAGASESKAKTVAVPDKAKGEPKAKPVGLTQWGNKVAQLAKKITSKNLSDDLRTEIERLRDEGNALRTTSLTPGAVAKLKAMLAGLSQALNEKAEPAPIAAEEPTAEMSDTLTEEEFKSTFDSFFKKAKVTPKAKTKKQDTTTRLDRTPPPDWREAVDQSDDRFYKSNVLQKVATMKSTPQELSDILDRGEELWKQGLGAGYTSNVFHDVSMNPAATPEIKTRAQKLYEEVMAPDPDIPNVGDIIPVKTFGKDHPNFVVRSVNENAVGIGPDYWEGTQTQIPLVSFKQWVDDLAGVVDVPPSDIPEINAVAEGKAKFIGKGDDGLVYKIDETKSRVAMTVKVSTVVPFIPTNPGVRTPEEAVETMRTATAVSEFLRENGVPGLLKTDFYEHGGKGFQVKPFVEEPEKMTGAQIGELRKSLDAMHEQGYALNDEVGAGLLDGHVFMFDTGKAGVMTYPKDQQEDDSRRFERFTEKMGQEALPLKAYAQYHWDMFLESKSEGLLRRTFQREWADKTRRGLIASGEDADTINAQFEGVFPKESEAEEAPAVEVKEGDHVTFTPNAEEKFAEPVTGTLVDIIKNTEGEPGYQIHAPLEGDEGRVVRVWASRGTIAVTEKPAETPEVQPSEEESHSAWEMTLPEWKKFEAKAFGRSGPVAEADETYRRWYKGQVLDALKAGKPVSDEVLNQYPEYRLRFRPELKTKKDADRWMERAVARLGSKKAVYASPEYAAVHADLKRLHYEQRDKDRAEADRNNTEVVIGKMGNSTVLNFAHQEGMVGSGQGMFGGAAEFASADEAKAFAEKHGYKIVEPASFELTPTEPTAPVVVSVEPKAEVIVGDHDATKHADLRLVVSKADQYYTLWASVKRPDGTTGRWRYVSILGKEREPSNLRAQEAARRIASGDHSGIAFEGKDQLRQDAKTIGVLTDLIGPDKLLPQEMVDLGEQTVGFGKHASTKIKDLLEKDPGWVDWAIAKGSGQRLRKIADYIQSQPDYIVAHDQAIADSRDAVTPEREELLKAFGLTAAARTDGGILIGGKTFDWKDTIKQFIQQHGGGGFDGDAQGWRISPAGFEAFSASLALLPRPTGTSRGQRNRVPTYISDPKYGELRAQAVGTPDRSGFEEPVGDYIGGDTRDLINNGLKYGIPQDILDEQSEDTARINRSYKRGERMFLLASQPGSGKTFVLGGAIRETKRSGAKKIGYVTQRQELIAQIKKDLGAFGVDDVEFFTYPGMRTADPKDLDVLIFDECVDAGTKISTPNGLRGIEDIKTGDVVYGFDHVTGAIKTTVVRRVFSRWTLSPRYGVENLRLTGNHPVWTERHGYVRADELSAVDELLAIVQNTQHVGDVDVRMVSAALCAASVGEATGPAVLRKILFSKVANEPTGVHLDTEYGKETAVVLAQPKEDACRSEGSGQTQRLSSFGSESLSEPRDSQKIYSVNEGKRVPESQRRQWSADPRASAITAIASWMGDGVRSRSEAPKARSAHELQTRPSRSGPENLRGTGWPVPPSQESNGRRQAKERVSEFVGVDSPAVHQPRGSQRDIFRLEEDPVGRYVFNIETSTGNYFADSFLVHNCHAIKNVAEGDGGASQAKAAAKWISQAKFTVLASATPYENPTQMAYFEPTGIFDSLGGHWDFAQAFGASERTIKLADGKTIKILQWNRGPYADADQAAIRDWLHRTGNFTSRRIRLPKDQVDARMTKLEVSETAAKMYNALTESAGEHEDELWGNGSMWVVNFQKRLLEAAKLERGMEEAEDAMKRGRWPIIFLETKAERKIDIPDMLELEERYRRAVSQWAGIPYQQRPPKPHRSEFTSEAWPKGPINVNGVAELLGTFMEKTNIKVIEIPSALDVISERFGKDKVAIFTGPTDGYAMTPKKAQANLDRWRTSPKPILLVATMAKGGTGLSLHDTVGNHQTTQIGVNLPWTATQVVQVTQRSARYGLKGKAELLWLFAENIAFDRKLAAKVGGRMADMGAIVHGAEITGARQIEDWNFNDRSFGEGAKETPVETEAQFALRPSAQTDTPEFKKWFGNSKVVDESGQPLVVYHGTPEDFVIFKRGTEGAVEGMYFTSNPSNAPDWGAEKGSNVQTLPVYLSIQNPAGFMDIADVADEFEDQGKEHPTDVTMRKALTAKGFDGVLIESPNENALEIVAFEPAQIKSAIGNRGTFDPKNPSVLFAVRPSVIEESRYKELKPKFDLAMAPFKNSKMSATDKLLAMMASLVENQGVSMTALSKMRPALARYMGAVAPAPATRPRVQRNKLLLTRKEYLADRMRDLPEGADPEMEMRSARSAHDYALKKAVRSGKFQEMIGNDELSPDRAIEILKSMGGSVPEYIKKEIASIQGTAYEIGRRMGSKNVGRPRADPETNSLEKAIRAAGGVKWDKDEANRGEVEHLRESGKKGLVSKNGRSVDQMAVHLSDTAPSGRATPTHEEVVKQALADGKPVPPEVLADYPQLKTPETAALFALRNPTYTPPYTITALKDEKLASKRGKEVKLVTIKQILKQPKTKQIERDIILEVLDTPEFQGKESFPFDDFEEAVQRSLMPLQVIETSSYSDYGSMNVGVTPTRFATHVYNSELQHGVTGHFSGVFERPTLDYEIREVTNPRNNRPVYITVPKDTELNEDNIADLVGTASGSREQAEEWLRTYKQYSTVNKGMFGWTRVWHDNRTKNLEPISEDSYIAEIQSDPFQKHDAEEMVVDSYINRYLATALPEVGEGNTRKPLKATTPLMQKVADLHEAEKKAKTTHSEVFEKLPRVIANMNAQIDDNKESIELGKTLLDSGIVAEMDTALDEAITRSGGNYVDLYVGRGSNAGVVGISNIFSSALTSNPKLKEKIESLKGRFKWPRSESTFDTFEDIPTLLRDAAQRAKIGAVGESSHLFVPIKDAIRRLEEQVAGADKRKADVVRQMDSDDYREYAQDQKLVDTLWRQLIQMLPIQDRQFIAHRKNYTTRLMREEIRRQAALGQKRLLIPTPRTLALIEGYISDEDRMPYEVVEGGGRNGDGDLTLGDKIKVGTVEYTVIDTDGNGITVAKSDDVFILDEYAEAEYQTKEMMSEVKEALKQFEDTEQRDDDSSIQDAIEEARIYGFQFDPADYFEVDGDGNYTFELTGRLESDIEDKAGEAGVDSIGDSFNDYGNVKEISQGRYIVTADKSTDTEEFNQPSAYSDRDSDLASFKIEDFTDTERTVLEKYDELNALFKKERPDAQIVDDGNGNQWLATNLTAEDTGPVAVFAASPRGWEAAEPGPVEKPEFTVEGNQIHLNHAGADLLTAAYRLGQQADQVPPQGIAGALEKTPESLAKALEMVAKNEPGMAEHATALAQAVRKAGKNGMVRLDSGGPYVVHEAVHEASTIASGHAALDQRHTEAGFDRMEALPQWETIRESLISDGYKDIRASLMEEAMAHLASGNNLGLTDEQANEFMEAWFRSFKEKNGSASLKHFGELTNAAEQARDKVASEAVARDRSNAVGLQGVSDRRKEGAGVAHGKSARRQEFVLFANRPEDEPYDLWKHLRVLAEDLQMTEGQKRRKLTETLEAAGLETGTNLFYDPETILGGVTTGKQLVDEKGIDGAIEWIKTGDGIEWASTGYEILARLRAQEVGQRIVNPAAAEAIVEKRLQFLNTFVEESTRRGQSIAGIKAIEVFAPDRAAYLLNKVSLRGSRERGISQAEEANIVQMAEELAMWKDRLQAAEASIAYRIEVARSLEDDLEAANARADAAAGTSTTKQTEPRVRKARQYEEKLDAQAETIKQTLLLKIGKMDFGNLKITAQFTGQEGKVGEDIKALPGDAEMLAQYAASRLGKVDTVEALNRELLDTFGAELEPYLSAIRQRAFQLRKNARADEIASKGTAPERRRTILAEIQKEIGEAKAAVKAAERAHVAAEKAQKKAAAQEQADVEGTVKAEAKRQQSATARASEKALRDKARADAKAARQQQRADRLAAIKEARERVKAIRKEYAQANEAEEKGWRGVKKEQAAAERTAGLWDTPVREEAVAARARLATATNAQDPDVISDLVSVMAAKWLPETPGGTPRKQAHNPAKLRIEIKDEFPDLKLDKKTLNRIYQRAYQRILDVTSASREAARLRSASTESKRLWDKLGLDSEAQAVLIQRAEAGRQQQILRAKMAAEFRRVSRTPFRTMLHEIGVLPRAFQSSIDAPLGRQGWFFAITHPVETMRYTIPATLRGYSADVATPRHLLALLQHPRDTWRDKPWKRGQFQSLVDTLQSRPRYHLAEEAGLDLPELIGESDRRIMAEEDFQSAWAEKFPHVRMSEQGFVLGMNEARLTAFDRIAALGEAEGYTWENNKIFFQQAAAFINAATGRANMPDLVKRLTTISNILFYSTRLNLSRVQVFNQLFNPIKYLPRKYNPFDTGGGGSGGGDNGGDVAGASADKGGFGGRGLRTFDSHDPVIRKMMAQEVLKLAIIAFALFLLAKQLGLGLVLDDLDDPDWGKLKVGNTRYDITGGHAATVRFLARFLRGLYETQTKDPKEMNPKHDPLALLKDFSKQKFAPWASFVYSVLYRKDVVGQPANFKVQAPSKMIQQNIIFKMVSPMVVGEFADGIADSGWIGVAKTLPSLSGLGVNTYKDKGIKGLTNVAVKEQLKSLKLDNDQVFGALTKDDVLDAAVQQGMEQRLNSFQFPKATTVLGQQSLLKDSLEDIRKIVRAEAAIKEPEKWKAYLTSKVGKDAPGFLTDEETGRLTEADLQRYQTAYANAYMELLKPVVADPDYQNADDAVKVRRLKATERRAHLRARSTLRPLPAALNEQQPSIQQ